MFNTIVIEPGNGVESLATRELVGKSFTTVEFPVAASSPLVPHLIKQELNSPTCRELFNFYDRDPTVCEWYYQAYGDEHKTSTSDILNPVANILVWLGLPKMVGRVVILKNGPVGGRWNMTPDVDPKALEQTLWWYHRSGRDIRTVSSERGLIRMSLNQT